MSLRLWAGVLLLTAVPARAGELDDTLNERRKRSGVNPVRVSDQGLWADNARQSALALAGGLRANLPRRSVRHVSSKPVSMREIVDRWFSNVADRVTLLDPGLQTVAIQSAHKVVAATVLVSVPRKGAPIAQTVVYPFPGQTDVVRDGTVRRMSDPGVPVTVTFYGKPRASVQLVRAELRIGKNVIPCALLSPKALGPRARATVAIVPAATLPPKTLVAVSIAARVGGRPWEKTWSFTTGEREVRPTKQKPEVGINRAIDRGVAWLKQRQGEDGQWGRISGVAYSGTGKYYRYPVGPTALSLYTLLACGAPPEDPAVARGFAFIKSTLQGHLPGSNYESAMLLMAIDARHPRPIAPGKRRRKKRHGGMDAKDHRWMVFLVKELGRQEQSGWDYGGEQESPASFDMSNTHFAMMGLYTAARRGLEVNPHGVASAIRRVLKEQEKTGARHERYAPPVRSGGTRAAVFDRARGWPYATGGKPTGSMTSAGLICLLTGRAILRDRLVPDLAKEVSIGVHDGVAWLDRNWTVNRNPPGRQNYHLLHLYGFERIGAFMGRRLIGKHNWYREGAAWLVQHQRKDGSWLDEGTHGPKDVLNTCFALLFLKRGTAALAATTR